MVWYGRVEYVSILEFVACIDICGLIEARKTNIFPSSI
jgi:hypothetical protein